MTPQAKQDQRTNFQWGMFLGIILGVIFAVFFFFVLENPNENIPLYIKDDAILAYPMLIGILFFVIGFLRGRATGDHKDGVRVIATASIIEGLVALAMMGLLRLIFLPWSMDQDGVLFALFGIDIEAGHLAVGWWIVQVLTFQIPLGVIDAHIGGAIGKRQRR